MKALLTTSEFNEFCAKVDKLEAKGYNEFHLLLTERQKASIM